MKLSYKRGFEPAHAVRRIVARMSWRARAASVAIVAAALGIGGLSLAAGAGATTLTCTNIAGPVSNGTPVGCGGLQTAAGYKYGNLDLTADGNYFNAVVRVQADNEANSNQDFTAFAVNGLTTGSYGDLGKYVAMLTPFGKIPQFTVTKDSVNPANVGKSFANAIPDQGATFTAGPADHCISVEDINNGPNHALRWNVVLRNCNTNGAFVYGVDNTTTVTTGSVSSGFANAYQEWAPVNGEFGLELVNVWITSHHHNVPYTLNITGASGAGTHTIAYPDTSPSLNESWNGLGCTPPLSVLGTPYASCP